MIANTCYDIFIALKKNNNKKISINTLFGNDLMFVRILLNDLAV